jgi:hypothetical protein
MMARYFCRAMCVIVILHGSAMAQCELQKLHAQDMACGTVYGNSVALSGTTMLVGSPVASFPGGASGAAYVYDLDASGAWIQSQELAPGDGDGLFGASVSISATDRDHGSGASNAQGAAYVFERTSDTKSRQQLLASEVPRRLPRLQRGLIG